MVYMRKYGEYCSVAEIKDSFWRVTKIGLGPKYQVINLKGLDFG